MNRAVIAAAAIIVGPLAVSQAFAGTPAVQTENLPQVSVPYSDLNVESEAGRRALTMRLTRAARGVCPDARARDLRTSEAGHRCVRKAVADAWRIVGEQRLARASKDADKRG